ncbi:MAG: carboxypeptidase regulatory-like domain-containing protein [Candidatus Aminicenantales bacterium]
MKKLFNIFLLTLLTVLLVSFSFAQRQTGSIHGLVQDEEQTPLPGATVTCSGPALLGTLTYVTGQSGKFRFPALPPGEDYQLKVEMPGFKTTIRKGLIVNVGKTTEITITLEVATIEEEVTVTAESPVVDTESSKVFVSYSSDFLANIPMARDLYDIQNSVPGAISEGRDYRRTSSILGGTVRSQLYTLDGVPLNDPATFYSMANINVDIYEEIEFGLGALPAEVGQTDSTHINIVSKSGGNTFSGTLWVEYTGKSLAQDLWTAEQIEAFEVDRPEKYTDFKNITLSFGGPIIKDRIWFFLNGRRQTWDKANPRTPENRLANINDPSLTQTELQHYDLNHQEWMGFGKLTFQITNHIRYMGMLHYNHIYEPVYTNRVGTSYSWAITAKWDHENTYATTHQFNIIFDQNTFLDIRGTYVYRYFPIIAREEYAGNYTTYDRKYRVWWGYTWYSDEYVRKRLMATAAFTRYQDDLLGADHQIKAGVEVAQNEYHRDWWRHGNPYYTYWRDYNKGNKYYYSTSGKRGRLRLRFCPPERGQWDVQDHVRRFSGYIQDSITTGRLALNLGVRLDYSYQYEPEQSRPQLIYNYGPEFQNPALTDPMAILNALIAREHAEGNLTPFDPLTTPWKKVVEFFTLSPRIGLVYDVFGDGKTAWKFSYSRYYEPVWAAKYNAAQIFGAGTYQWYWYDLNGNGYMDLPTELDPDGDDYRIRYRYNQDPSFNYYKTWESIQEFWETGDPSVLKDGLKAPYMDEFIVGLEHELMRDFKLGLQFVYKVNKNIVEDVDMYNGYDPSRTDENGLIWIPYTVIDPGFDGEWGTSDDQPLTVYGLRDDRPEPEYLGTNPPEAKRKYWAVILTFDKRMSNNWQLKGSVLYSSFKGNAEATYGPTEGESGAFDNPNARIYDYGPIWFDRPLQIKLMGTFILPYDFMLSAYFQARSGSPWARSWNRVYFPSDVWYQGVAYDVQQSYVGVLREQRGSQRNRFYTRLDLRLEKTFRIGDLGKISLYIDALNVGGHSGVNVYQNEGDRLYYYVDQDGNVTRQEWRVDSLYGTMSSVYGVRSYRIGARISF